MKRFINIITNGKPGRLVRPLVFQVLQSILQGVPYYVILLVVLEFLKPILSPGTPLDSRTVYLQTAFLAFATFLLFLCGKFAYNDQNIAAYSIACDGRIALGEYLRRLPMGFFKGRDPGDITALMLQDYTNVESMLSHLLMDAIGSVALPLVFLAYLFPLDWRMTLVTVSVIPVAILVAFVTRALIIKLGERHVTSKNAASSRMLEYLDGMKNIKAHNLQGKKFVRLESAFRKLKTDSIRLEAGSGPAVILGAIILNAGIALIMVFGVRYLLDGSLSLVNFLFFLIVGTRMYDPLVKVLMSFAELSYYSLSASRISKLFEEKVLPESESSPVGTGNDIEFRNVTFRYHDRDVLKSVSFSLRENTMTALVGPSGSGKSTVTRLIARFWDANSGEILIGGRPLRDYRTEDLMSRISMVFQDVYLFNDTILNNIKVGKSDATRDEVIAAAKQARCHEFISALPNGYDTMVGEGGNTLSGGEKQRVSIARAILKNAPVVLLDEATASLDPENEVYIQQAIAELIKGRTIVVIAHRLSTVTRADQIIVLRDGVIAESGAHDALLASGGAYADMWAEQRKAHSWKLRGVGASA
jgi:ATP-binding cassette subfamily B protein